MCPRRMTLWKSTGFWEEWEQFFPKCQPDGVKLLSLSDSPFCLFLLACIPTLSANKPNVDSKNELLFIFTPPWEGGKDYEQPLSPSCCRSVLVIEKLRHGCFMRAAVLSCICVLPLSRQIHYSSYLTRSFFLFFMWSCSRSVFWVHKMYLRTKSGICCCLIWQWSSTLILDQLFIIQTLPQELSVAKNCRLNCDLIA